MLPDTERCVYNFLCDWHSWAHGGPSKVEYHPVHGLCTCYAVYIHVTESHAVAHSRVKDLSLMLKEQGYDGFSPFNSFRDEGDGGDHRDYINAAGVAPFFVERDKRTNPLRMAWVQKMIAELNAKDSIDA